ncbi:MAG: hypothetical protein ABI435_05175 [Pseudolysinimonas sp.]
MKKATAIEAALCRRFGVTPVPLEANAKVGASRSVRDGLMPINGLRHPPSEGTSGWFIWAGEDLSDAPDFFVPLHVEHLIEWRPEVLPYLALPPGSRFLIAQGYEDVWADESLLSP